VRFTLRDYRGEDFNTIWEIDQACFPPGISYSRYELSYYLRRSSAFSLIAESLLEGETAGESDFGAPEVGAGAKLEVHEILAFLVAESNRRGVGHVITIDVRSNARRHGVGSSLLEAAETRLRSTKCNTVRLETAVDNVSALGFYKRHGYDVIKTIPRYYSNGVDALLLEKNLLSSGSSR
jgi:ribosomal-protein-alanine N-acetyltransferase